MKENILQIVPYPIIVCNSFDNFYHLDMQDETGAIQKISLPFQLEVNYAYIDDNRNGQNEYFILDVIGVDKLPEFTSILEEKEIKAIKENLSWKQQGL